MKERLQGKIEQIHNFADFNNVFIAYTSFPYYEEWETEEIRKQYDEHVENGYMYGYYYDGKCVGLLSMLPAVHRNHPIYFSDKSTALYVSNLAVICEYRYHGIGTNLAEYAVEFAKQNGYKEIYFRYRETHEFGERIAKRLNFFKCYDSCEVVKRPRNYNFDRDDTDLRFFMKKNV